jgi:site-specific DNA recombinase
MSHHCAAVPFYFFCRGRQLRTCDAPYSNYERVEEAVIEHYKTIRFSPEFIASMRAELEATVADSTQSQQELAKQIKAQLKKLAAQEENLIDMVADGTLPKSKVQSRLHRIEEQREQLKAQETCVDEQLAQNAAYIDGCLTLLEDPAELYRQVGDTTRRMLNQAIFRRLYVYNDEVVGHEMNEPLAELLAFEAGERALAVTGSQDAAVSAAQAVLRRHAPQRSKATPEGGLASLGSSLEGLFQGQGSSKSHLVELRGIEPRSSSVETGLLRVQSALSLFSAPVLATDTSPTGPVS